MLPKTNRIRSCISKGLHRVSNEASQKGLPPAFSESAFRGERIGFSPWPCLPYNSSGRAAGSDGCSAKAIRTCCHPCVCPSHHGGPRRFLSGPLPVAGPVRSRPISTGPARAHGISPGISRVTRPHGSVGLIGELGLAGNECARPLSVVPCHEAVDSDVTGQPLVAGRSPGP